MAVTLIKIFITAVASTPVATGGTVETTVSPDVTRYVAVIDAGMIGATDTTIPAASFVDDAGNAITDLPDPPTNGYYNVYANGMLQEAGLSVLTTTDLTLATIDVPEGAPVVLEVADFGSTTSTITVEPTISAPTITVTR